MDRSRPLWQFTLFTGPKSGEVGLYGKGASRGARRQGGTVLANSISI